MSNDALTVYLAECEALRNDILSRFEFQRQTFNYMVVLVAAGLGFAATWKPDTTIHPSEFLVFIPFIAAPLAYVYFDNEMVIWANGKYIDEVLCKKIDAVLKHDAISIEQRMKWHLSRGQSVLHLLLSTGRWLIFFIPLAGPTLYGILKPAIRYGHVPGAVPVPYWCILVIDCLLTALALFAAVGVIVMRNNAWGNPLKSPTVTDCGPAEPIEVETTTKPQA